MRAIERSKIAFKIAHANGFFCGIFLVSAARIFPHVHAILTVHSGAYSTPEMRGNTGVAQ
ncbi:hypothetical protein D3870_00730 [Noviherbaspirillum cavernae]|uniref:Uncharacterized protein n=1 Tax=Noviherbaspirillum cavernae TaxID=2320862 RepID=A0A418WWW4_9BURK|nr:hypothetical protein D3870_00730 [Noviherbaspirillum cavernae]